MLVQPFGFLAQAGGIITDGLLHWYNPSAASFQNPTATNWADLSTLYSNTLNASAGFGFSFDGINSWLFNNNANILRNTIANTFTGLTGYTVEAWVTWNGGTITSQDKGLISLYNWSTGNQTVGMYLSLLVNAGVDNGKAQAYISAASSNPGHHTFGTSIGSNTWGHVAWTVEVGSVDNLKLYTNGQPDGTVSVPLSAWDFTNSSNEEHAVGRNPQNTNRAMSGYIGVVRNYQRALSATEILNNYNQGVV